MGDSVIDDLTGGFSRQQLKLQLRMHEGYVIFAENKSYGIRNGERLVGRSFPSVVL